MRWVSATIMSDWCAPMQRIFGILEEIITILKNTRVLTTHYFFQIPAMTIKIKETGALPCSSERLPVALVVTYITKRTSSVCRWIGPAALKAGIALIVS